MNLFDILSAGKRDLNEENVSSFLSWMLDPKQSHGCGSLFLIKLLNIIDKNRHQQWISKIQNTFIDVVVEEEVVTNGKRRFVDIVIVMSAKKENCKSIECNGNGENESIVFAIENKIRESAYDETQLKEEYEGLKESYQGSEILFLYLTPKKSLKFQKAFSLLPEDITKSHLTWADSSDEQNNPSIVDMFRNILDEDLNAKINPLSNELKFVLKSFIVFAENGFRALNSSSAPNSVKRNGNKYFKDTVSGINGLRELRELQKTGEIGQVYVGFIGGTKALKEQGIEKLENRPYKWDETLENKSKINWILIEEFIEIVDKNIIHHES